MQETKERQVQSLGQEDPLEKEMENPLQYSCLGNPMDSGAWQAIVHEVTKSWTQLNNLYTYTHNFGSITMLGRQSFLI